MKNTLPKFILVVSIIRCTDNAELVGVLKDYFSGVPYIVSLIFTESHISELHEIIEEFLHTLPHINTEIIIDNKQAKPIPCL